MSLNPTWISADLKVEIRIKSGVRREEWLID